MSEPVYIHSIYDLPTGSGDSEFEELYKVLYPPGTAVWYAGKLHIVENPPIYLPLSMHYYSELCCGKMAACIALKKLIIGVING